MWHSFFCANVNGLCLVPISSFFSAADHPLRFFHFGPSRASTVPVWYCPPNGSQQHPLLPPWLQSWSQQHLSQICFLFLLPTHSTLSLPQRSECLPRRPSCLSPALSRDRMSTTGYKAATVPGCLVSQSLTCDFRIWWSSPIAQKQNATFCWVLCHVIVDVSTLRL